METEKKGLWIVLGVVGAAIFLNLVFLTYNYVSLVILDKEVKAAWARLERQLERRNGLIPNLLQAVKGHAEHERGLLQEVTKARARVGEAATLAEKVSANNSLTEALSRLLRLVGRNPDFKSDQNIIRLQGELAGIEKGIGPEGRRYNGAARALNRQAKNFPASLVAALFGFRKAPLYEGPELELAVNPKGF